MKVQNQNDIIDEIDRYLSEICFSILEDEEDNEMVENLQRMTMDRIISLRDEIKGIHREWCEFFDLTQKLCVQYDCDCDTSEIERRVVFSMLDALNRD